MTVALFLLDALYAVQAVSPNSPYGRWIDLTPACIDRVCEHAGCLQRNAIAEYVAFYHKELCQCRGPRG